MRRTQCDGALMQGHRTADAIEAASDRITDVLTEIATLDSVRTEIDDTIHLLRTAHVEAPAYRRADRSNRLRVYLPSNNALYSLGLFMLLPGLFLDDVLVRPASRIKKHYLALQNVLADHLPDHVRMRDYTQREFLDVSHGCTVVFNGRPENGYRLAESLNDSTFLGFGAGPNPAVIGSASAPGALPAACESVVRSRMYNNGQDCLCPDVIFVHSSVADVVVDTIVSLLGDIAVTADNRTPGLVNVPLLDDDAYRQFRNQAHALRDRVVWTGETSGHPTHAPITVAVRDIAELSAECPEYFGPMFDIAIYDDWADVENYLHGDPVAAGGMYVFGFGEPALEQNGTIGTFRNTFGVSPFDYEDGHLPFGGHGVRSSWVQHRGGSPVGRPILLSAELERAAVQPTAVAS